MHGGAEVLAIVDLAVPHHSCRPTWSVRLNAEIVKAVHFSAVPEFQPSMKIARHRSKIIDRQ
jgi:hypothetical protein